MAETRDQHEVWMESIRKDPCEFISVPLEHRTYELCLSVVSLYPDFIEYVPLEHRTYELCMIAANKDDILEHVPMEHRTLELCKIIVGRWGFSLENIPDEQKTPELCMAAVENYCSGSQLEFIPDEMLTYEMCLKAVTNTGGGEGHLLEFVPDRLKTFELCYEAVSHYIFAISYVPVEFKTCEMYSLLFGIAKRDYDFGDYASQDNPHEFCLAAVLHDGSLLACVPCEYQTEEVVFAAIESDDRNIEYVLNPSVIREDSELLALYIESL